MEKCNLYKYWQNSIIDTYEPFSQLNSNNSWPILFHFYLYLSTLLLCTFFLEAPKFHVFSLQIFCELSLKDAVFSCCGRMNTILVVRVAFQKLVVFVSQIQVIKHEVSPVFFEESCTFSLCKALVELTNPYTHISAMQSICLQVASYNFR